MDISVEIIFGIVQAILTAIFGFIFKDNIIPSKYIPIQNIIIGIICGILTFYYGIYDNIFNSILICLAISLGVGGSYDVYHKLSKEDK